MHAYIHALITFIYIYIYTHVNYFTLGGMTWHDVSRHELTYLNYIHVHTTYIDCIHTCMHACVHTCTTAYMHNSYELTTYEINYN